MDTRIEQRKKDFKKTFEDSRRRREEQQVQIRKSQREERFSKRRQQIVGDATVESVGVGSGGVGANGNLGGSVGGVGGTTSKHGGTQNHREVNESIRQSLQLLHSTDMRDVAAGVLELRRLLSVPNLPPIAEVIAVGAVPRLVALMGDDGVPQTVAFDAAWSLTNIASGNHEQTAAVVEAGAIPVFARLLRCSDSSEVREQSAWALGNIAGDCPNYRDLVLANDVLKPMIDELRSAMVDPQKKSVLVNCCWALSNFCRGRPRPDFEVISTCIPVLRDIILSTEMAADVVADACWALSYVTDGNDDRSYGAVDAVLLTGVAPRLVQLMSTSVTTVQTPALRVVGNVVSGTESQTQTMLAAQCVPALKGLLTHSRKLIRKEACWTISNITAGTQAQIAAVLQAELLQDILTMLPAADMEIKSEGWWAIANAASGASHAQVKELMNMGCMRELAAILANDAVERKLHCVVLEALENIFSAGQQLGGGGANNPYVLLLEEAGGFSALEKMQFLPDGEKAKDLAVQLIRKYMQFDECTDAAFDYAGAPANNNVGGGDGFDFSGFQMQ